MEHIGDAPPPRRLRHDGRAPVDPGLALGLLWIIAVLGLENSSHAHVALIPAAVHNTSVRWLVVVCAIAVAIPALALRHRQPLAALFAVVAAIAAAPAALVLLGPALVVLYTVAVTLGGRDTALAALGVVAGFVVQRAAWGPIGDIGPTALIGTVASAGLGLYIRVSRESARDRTAFEHRQEAFEADRAVVEQRVRIARELHDVVAHTLSLIIVQSEVMRTNLADEIDRSNAGAIAELGRDAMAELHRTLELLRGGDELAERAPWPVLSDLQQLSDQSRHGGLDVELGIGGAVRPLPASFELCAYRIVQEALTNVRRHADAAHATVRVRFGTAALEVAIEDDGVGVTTAVTSTGHGLRGMRERVATLGGEVSAGPCEQGGYRVSAILPYPEPL